MARKDRAQKAIKLEVSSIIHDELNDPRIGFATVTAVELSADLQYAKIFVSVLGEAKQIQETFDALKSAKGYIRSLLSKRLRMRSVPDLVFKQDTSAEYSVYIANKIDELKKQQ